MHEAERLRFIEEEKSRRRQLAGLKQGATAPVVANLPQREKGKTRDKVAEQVGRKPTTFRSIQKVWEAAHDEAAPAPIRAVAQQQMAALDTGETTPNAADKASRWGRCARRSRSCSTRRAIPTVATVAVRSFSLTM